MESKHILGRPGHKQDPVWHSPIEHRPWEKLLTISPHQPGSNSTNVNLQSQQHTMKYYLY
jgi:hypothetical protein